MENEKMDSNGIFWINLWRIVATVIITLVLAITIAMHYDSVRRQEAWIKCVELGGQPISQPMLGTEIPTFTCIRK